MSVGTSTMYVNSSTAVLLQTAQALVGQPGSSGRKVKERIVFDSCSQRTYVSQHLKENLDLSLVGSDTLKITAFGDDEPSQKEYEQVQFSITALDGMELYAKGYVVPTICSPICTQSVQAVVERYPHLCGLCLAEKSSLSNEVEVDVLLGADYYWNFVTNIIRRGVSPGPVAIWTKLGWVLSGPVVTSSPENPQQTSVNLTTTNVLRVETSTVQPENIPNLKNELVKFWDLETLGIQEKEPSVYDKFTQEVHFNGDRYEAKLPFKDEHPLLPDNYSICEKRLGSLIKRLRATPSVLQEYHKVIEDQLNTGVVELVEEVDGKSPGHVHYLPHKEVVRNDKDTTKLRIVYDASAKKTGPSLNDCLYVGPPLTPLIFNILT
ncbi:uncharacterized protein LOC114536353 [Dendronephthya gigantea]|uniref:uncharacterized protein LOC114536353 n=1 Tax=Dendronephthya gigantea TaxID=151771 RepID=UPI00106C99FF|nr:uncharacterized protein LOC114536353 [Dendronephthya gigantea]